MDCSCATASTAKLSALTPVADTCPTIVHEEVCVQGTVTISPKIETGEIKSFCIGNPLIGRCGGELKEYCSFVVSQKICVQVPLTFSAEAAVAPNGIVCGSPATGSCGGIEGCTYTIGYYKNHEDVTNALITAAGGSITLGTGSGLSLTATAANADAILSGNAPVPPAPVSPPLQNQYRILYAQLLAAKLNMLNIGGTVCDFITAAVAAADSFLGTSPEGGKTGAPAVQEPLAAFNEGDAPGCPQHCDDEA